MRACLTGLMVVTVATANVAPVFAAEAPAGTETTTSKASVVKAQFVDAAGTVVAGEEPVDACEEHDSRNYQIIFHVYHNSYLLRAINNPPTIHANNKMLTASKGSR